MKRILTLILIFLFMLGVAIAVPVFFPQTVQVLEGDDYFLLTREFFITLMAQPSALCVWLMDFLLQFYRWPVVAGIIEALLLGMVGLSAYLLFCKFGRKEWSLLSLVPMLVMVAIFPFQINLRIEAVTCFLAIWGYASLTNRWFRYAFSVIFTFIAFLLMGMPLATCTFAVFALLEYVQFKGKYFCAIPLCCILLEALLINMSSNYITFIPSSIRYFHTYSITETYLNIIWLVTIIGTFALSYFLAKPKKDYTLIAFPVGVVLAALSICCNTLSSKLQYNERIYTYAALADNHNWNELKSLIQEDGVGDDLNRMRYGLLAESGLGTLPENLFNYPINTPEDLLFRHDRSRMGNLFNRQFYEHCGIYDNAMHYAFEYADQCHSGFCFSSMRHMVDYAIKEADFPVAEKFLHVLSLSTLHDSFVAEHLAQIASLKKKGVKPQTPLRYDNFVDGYPFNSEMIRQLQLYPKNKTFLDYLLCGLLLQKELDKFRVILYGFPLYQNQQLPKAYAEACAMLSTQNINMRDKFNYSGTLDAEFSHFYQSFQANDPNLKSQYANSYWSYFFLAQIPDPSQISFGEGH